MLPLLLLLLMRMLLLLLLLLQIDASLYGTSAAALGGSRCVANGAAIDAAHWIAARMCIPDTYDDDWCESWRQLHCMQHRWLMPGLAR